MDEMTLTLNSPITEKQWDIIEDVDFENTDRIWFHTKNGKDVEFIKRKTGKWIDDCTCSVCYWTHEDSNGFALLTHYNYCPNCGYYMRGESE